MTSLVPEYFTSHSSQEYPHLKKLFIITTLSDEFPGEFVLKTEKFNIYLVLLSLMVSCSSIPEKLRGPAAVTALPAGSCFHAVERVLSSGELRKFKKKFHHFTDFGVSSNRKFIKVASSSYAEEGLLYFHVENQFLKYLNDKVFKDKQITYGLTVLYQETFYKELMKDPYLSNVLAVKYADYKGLRLGFNSESVLEENRILTQLQKLYDRVATKFEQELQSYPFQSYLSQESDELFDPKKWFIPGAGRSADRAAAASRIARQIKDNRIPHFQRKKEEIELLLKKVNSLHQKILSNFLDRVSSGFLSSSFIEESDYVLSIEVIDLIRKVSVDPSTQFSKFKKSIQQYYGFSINQEEFDLLLSYVKAVDVFSPPVYQENTTPINLANAIKGVISADIAQKGAEGQFQNMSRLIGVDSPATAIERVREGYWIVDRNLREAKDWFLTAINYTGPPDNIKKVYHSGDDILFFPDEEITRVQKSVIVKKLSLYKDPSEFRLVFLPPKYMDTGVNIGEGVKSKMIVEAENLEKRLRRLLKSELSIGQAKKLGIAINVRPSTDKVSYEVFIGSSSEIPRKRIRLLIKSIEKSSESSKKIKILFVQANS